MLKSDIEMMEIHGKVKYKKIVILSLITVLFISVIFTMNMEVSIKQGKNGIALEKRMPLYVKLLDFWIRSYHYKLLYEEITRDSKTDKEKLLALFEWTSLNIRHVPNELPVVDDHVDNIIIRGYGTDDQSADVFTTLAVLAGFKGGIYLTKIYPEKVVHALSIINFNGEFVLFDTYTGFIFHNKNGEMATLDEIRNDINLVKSVANDYKMYDKYLYLRFFENLKPVEEIGWSKADLQFYLNRMVYIFERLFKISKPSNVFYGESYG